MLRLLRWGRKTPTTEQFILDTVKKHPNMPEGYIRMLCHVNSYDMYRVGLILDWLVREGKIYRYRIRNHQHREFGGYMLSMVKPLDHAAEFITDLVEGWGAITQDYLLKMCDEIGYSMGLTLEVLDILQKERKLFSYKITNPLSASHGRIAFTSVMWK